MVKSNRDRSEETRTTLKRAARQLFLENGYANTATPQIVAAAGVTRGALYHHFADKRDLFRAIIEDECRDVATEIEKGSLAAPTALAALKQGAAGFIDAMTRSGRTRLVLIDAPAVLGPETVTAIEDGHARKSLAEGLAQAMKTGEMRRLPLVPLVELLSAMFDRAALNIEAGMNRRTVEGVVMAMLDGLAVVD